MQWIEHGGRLNAEGLEAKIAAEEGLGASGADSSRGRNRSGNRRDEGSQGSALRFDELREFEPIRFVLECTLRPGEDSRQELLCAANPTSVRNLNPQQRVRVRQVLLAMS